MEKDRSTKLPAALTKCREGITKRRQYAVTWCDPSAWGSSPNRQHHQYQNEKDENAKAGTCSFNNKTGKRSGMEIGKRSEHRIMYGCWMLLALVSQQIVATSKAIDLVAARDTAEENGLLVVFAFVSVEVLGVKESLLANVALVGPLRAVEVLLLVTTRGLSRGQCRQDLSTHLRSHARSKALPQSSTVHR